MYFALNHMVAPGLGIGEFFALARQVGCDAVEIRNDLAGAANIGNNAAPAVRSEAAAAGVSILSINALQRFNIWTDERREEALALADYAAACGSQALVLVPLNDGSNREDGVRQANLQRALTELTPILAERGLIGLVEPLGFEVCSLRRKSEALAAIDAVGGGEAKRLVHDTFHHHLAGEAAIFPGRTGLVHISGVDDPGVSVADMRDDHRVLVDTADQLGNLDQISVLSAGGFAGALSFEPFASTVHALNRAEIAAALTASMALIRSRISIGAR